MKQFAFLFLLLSSASFAQDLAMVKATKQTINSGAAPTSTINYLIEIKRSKKCKLSIDSVVNVYTQKTTAFNVVKVDNPESVSPKYKPVNASSIKDKGMFQITFASMKNRGSGRPGTPMNLIVPIADFTQGAIVYYTAGKKKKQLLVESFEELETINAP
ncbi:MAG: hypothetical protein NTX97_05305 [Bacteroidetes bacterium]|nr:hypothetical protein [Bacteroidota bacterium]